MWRSRNALDRLAKMQHVPSSEQDWSPLYLVCTTGQKYLCLEATEANWQEARQDTLSALSQWQELQPSSDLLEVLLQVQDNLPDLPTASQLSQLQELDAQLHQGPHSEEFKGLLQRAWRAKEESKVLCQLDLEVNPQDLRAGHLQVLQEMIAHQSEEQARNFLADLRQEMEIGYQEYQMTPLRPEDWTLEVAMADAWMEQGYAIWLDCLEWLSHNLWEPSELEAIWQDLLEANRLWIWVERLGRASRQSN